MTPRERVLHVLDGQGADRVPWFADLDYWTTARIARGEVPEDFRLQDAYIDWHQDLGCGFYLQGYQPFRGIPDGYEAKTWAEGTKRFRTIRTPKGTLTESWQYLASSFSQAHVDYLVRSAADLPAYRYFVEHTRYEPNYEFARNRAAQIGEAGVVLVYTPRTPFMRLLAIDAGLENMMTIMMEDPDGFDDTIALMRRRFTDAAALAAACPADIVMIPENLSAEMVGPRLFRRYMQDCQVQWSEMIKRNGKHSCIHMDGTLRGLLREEASIGLTFIEACTPEPVGDVPVRDWPSYIRGTNTCLWGGIPGAYFTEQVDDEEFDRHVVETLSVMRREPRYVLGVADQVPPDGLERRMRRVRELVDIHGNYE